MALANTQWQVTPANRRDGADLVRHLRHLYESSKNHRRQRLPVWTRNYQLVNNRFGSAVSEPWMPSPRTSEVYPILSTRVAWLADQRLNVTYSAAADPNSGESYEFYQRLADDLTTVYQSTWQALNFEQQCKLAFWDEGIYGIGIFKTNWDQALDDGNGNISLARIHPWALYVDPKATSFDTAEFIIEARRMSLEEVDRRYPGHHVVLLARRGPGELDEPPRMETSIGPDIPLSNVNPSTLGGGNMTGITRSQLSSQGLLPPGGETVVYECWLKENDQWYDEADIEHIVPRWRVVVVSQGEILLDEYADQLWSHKGHPYDRFCSEDIGEFYGIALVDHLAYPQVYINRLLAAVQLNTELTGNPVLIEPEQSMTSRVAWTNKPGQRVPVKGAMQSPNAGPHWLTPPSMPPIVMQLMEFWLSRMNTVSGLDAAKNMTKQGGARTAESVMSSMQEATFVRIRAALVNWEACLRGIAQKHADLIIDNYTDPRILAIVGPAGQQSALALRAGHFNTGQTPFKYSISVDAGSQLPTSLAGRISRELQLFTLGITDDEAVLSAMRYPHMRQVLTRKYVKMQMGLGQAPGARQRRQKGA